MTQFPLTKMNSMAVRPYLNQNLSATLTVTQIQDQQYTPIWPYDIAGADLVYPAEYK